MTETEVLVQQLIIGLSNGMIIALIALGYTMVYGLVELINFAHGDLFMLGCFVALTLLGMLGLAPLPAADQIGTVQWFVSLAVLFTVVPTFCGLLNVTIDKLAYRKLRNAPRLVPLVSALGVSFILLNVGLFWGGLPMDAFNLGNAAAAPKPISGRQSSKRKACVECKLELGMSNCDTSQCRTDGREFCCNVFALHTSKYQGTCSIPIARAHARSTRA